MESKIKVKQLYTEYVKGVNHFSGGTGCYMIPMTLEEFTYTFTWQYKLKKRFKNLWIVRKFKRFIYRIETIWRALTNLDSFE